MTLLSPLLPVARALRVPVLDFDTYLSLRDGPQVAEQAGVLHKEDSGRLRMCIFIYIYIYVFSM